MNITIGISSGIAAFKILDLIPLLQKKGHTVQIILTKSAEKMVSIEELMRLTKNKVFTTLFEKDFDYKEVLKDRIVEHIEVAKNTDLFVLAPATANLVAKLANGISDDFLTTTILATVKPILVVPSMNTNMWNHPATQHNLKTLQSYGYFVMKPNSGWLACGVQGVGRLPEVREIAQEIDIILNQSSNLKGKKIIITAGGTLEEIDSARILTNKSTGKMGIALAEACFLQGAEVLLVRSAQSITTYLPIQQITFQSAKNLEDILKNNVKEFNYLIHAAAVSDFIPEKIEGKLDSDNEVTLQLKPAEKIINNIKKWNPDIQLIGFKAIYNVQEKSLVEILAPKFTESKADSFIVNDISRTDIGFGSNENEVYIVGKDGKVEKLEKDSKKKIANKIVNVIFK
jgi:phosphopantothenoylcysteine decarboxylase/phosphopantothenate--cysteine ligase